MTGVLINVVISNKHATQSRLHGFLSLSLFLSIGIHQYNIPLFELPNTIASTKSLMIFQHSTDPSNRWEAAWSKQSLQMQSFAAMLLQFQSALELPPASRPHKLCPIKKVCYGYEIELKISSSSAANVGMRSSLAHLSPLGAGADDSWD